MRLSDVKGERTLEVIADLVEPIANIAQDKDTMALFERKEVPEGLTANEFFVSRVKTALPALLKTHKDDFVSILSTIKGVSAEEYTSSLTLASLLSDVFELLTDEDILAFLTSANTNMGELSSGSASESAD